MKEGSFTSSRMNSASLAESCRRSNRSVSRMFTRWPRLFLAPIDDRLDQLYRDPSTGDEHPNGVGGHIEEQIACQDAFDLIAPLFATAADITQQGVELDNHALAFVCPLIFERIHGTEVQFDHF